VRGLRPGTRVGAALGRRWGRDRVWAGQAPSGLAEGAAGPEQAQQLVLAVAVQRQVQGQVPAAVPGQPGGNIDQVSADGGTASLRVSRGGREITTQDRQHT
jgi:hypothetical protein